MKPVPQTVLYGEHAYSNGNFFETTIIEYSKNSLTGEWVY